MDILESPLGNFLTDSIPEFPAKYSKKLGRIIAEPSLNPVNLVRNGTWVTWTAVGILAFCLCIVLALIGFVRKKFIHH